MITRKAKTLSQKIPFLSAVLDAHGYNDLILNLAMMLLLTFLLLVFNTKGCNDLIPPPCYDAPSMTCLHVQLWYVFIIIL